MDDAGKKSGKYGGKYSWLGPIGRFFSWLEEIFYGGDFEAVVKAAGDAKTTKKTFNPQELAGRLLEAINQNDIDGVRRAINDGANINIKLWTRSTGEYPLYRAADKGNARIVEALLEHGADYHMSWASGGISPLHVAVRNGSVDTVKAFLSHGVDAQDPFELLFDTDLFPRTARNVPLVTAIYGGNPEMVRVLLEAGANKIGIGESTLREARKIPAIAKLLNVPVAKERAPETGLSADEIDAAYMARAKAEAEAAKRKGRETDRPTTADERFAARLATVEAAVAADEREALTADEIDAADMARVRTKVAADEALRPRPTGRVRSRGMEM